MHSHVITKQPSCLRLLPASLFFAIMLIAGLPTLAMEDVDNKKQELGKQLWRAVDLQDIHAIDSLIEANADVNYPNERGTTPFMLTAHRPLEIFQTLLKANGNIYWQSKTGSTALSMAAAWQKMPIISMLLTIATTLAPTQKDVVKAWLFANKKLEKMKRVFLPKDTRILIAQNIIQILSQSLHGQVIQAGGLGAIQQAHKAVMRWKRLEQFAARVGETVDSKEDTITPLLNQYLNPNFLAHLAHQQSSWPKLQDRKAMKGKKITKSRPSDGWTLEEQSKVQTETQTEENSDMDEVINLLENEKPKGCECIVM